MPRAVLDTEWTDGQGTTHPVGATVDVDEKTLSELVAAGKATAADPDRAWPGPTVAGEGTEGGDGGADEERNRGWAGPTFAGDDVPAGGEGGAGVPGDAGDERNRGWAGPTFAGDDAGEGGTDGGPTGDGKGPTAADERHLGWAGPTFAGDDAGDPDSVDESTATPAVPDQRDFGWAGPTVAPVDAPTLPPVATDPSAIPPGETAVRDIDDTERRPN